MTFQDWIFSNYKPGDEYSGQWKFLHIVTLCVCIGIILALTFLFRKKKQSTRENILKILALFILFFELARRIINLFKGSAVDWHSALYILLPRPWCAISCWLLIISAVCKKKTFWNVSAINALLCSIVFFAYPAVGFNHKHLLFENIYSITTHALLLISSVCILTLHIGDFRYKRERFQDGFLQELILLAIIFIYTRAEIALDLSIDPLYFLPMAENEAQAIVGLGNTAYVTLYTIFLCVWINAFYTIPLLYQKYHKKANHV